MTLKEISEMVGAYLKAADNTMSLVVELGNRMATLGDEIKKEYEVAHEHMKELASKVINFNPIV